jgi:hypothetical protein
MIVWGGSDFLVDPTSGPAGAGNFSDGAAYDPATRTWRDIADPPYKVQYSEGGETTPLTTPAVWTGEEMLIFGYGRDLGRAAGPLGYDPRTDRWRELATPPTGLSLASPSVVWTGSRVLVYGGVINQVDETGAPLNLPGDAASYDPTTDSWRTLAPFPLGPRGGASVTWTGNEMIVWGGQDPALPGALADGAAYDAGTDSWRMLPASPLVGRTGQGAAWTGQELIIWGGSTNPSTSVADGAAYDPRANTWRALSASPLAPSEPTAITWTGAELLVVGGRARGIVGPDNRYGTFVGGTAVYDPKADAWSRLPAPPAVACTGQTSVWTGSSIILWGGRAKCTGPAGPATNAGISLHLQR